MFDELKELIQLVNGLPHLALWVAAGFWAYKVIVIGSIYGLIRFFIEKAHDWLTAPKTIISQLRWKNLRIHDEEALETLLLDVIRSVYRSKDPSLATFFYTDAQRALREAWEHRNVNK